MSTTNPLPTSVLVERAERLAQFAADFKNMVFDNLVRSIVLGTFRSKVIMKNGFICQFYDLETVASIKYKILERAMELFPEFPDAEEMACVITNHTGEYVTFDNDDLYEWQCRYEQHLSSIEQGQKKKRQELLHIVTCSMMVFDLRSSLFTNINPCFVLLKFLAVL